MANATSRARTADTVGRFYGRVAAITGAASGIGRAIATRLAAEGAQVVCGDLQRHPVDGGLDPDQPTDVEISSQGGQAVFIEWDVTDEQQTRSAFELARSEYGRIDIVVANAGVALDAQPLPDEQAETWERQLKINLTGAWNTVRYGLKALIDQDEGGRIITMSSVAGLLAFKGLASAYGVSKAGIIELTRQAAIEGALHGITANTLCPGFVRTAINPTTWQDGAATERYASLHPLGRLGEASDVAGAVAFLASDDASWITGVVLPVDGGMTCV